MTPADRDGFTLIEVVLALLIATLLCGTVASALTNALLDEQATLRQMEAALIPDMLVARLQTGVGDPVAPEGWVLETADFTERKEDVQQSWKIHAWTPDDRPGPRVVFAWRQGTSAD